MKKEYHKLQKIENGRAYVYCKRHDIYYDIPEKSFGRTIGCPECKKEIKKSKLPEKIKKFKEYCSLKHKNFYDYSKVKFEITTEYIEIICPNHGSFKQMAYSHKQGIGCPKCADERVSNSLSYDKEDWLDKIKEVHGERYEYGDINLDDKTIEVICKKHGKFVQELIVHRHGHGCPNCANEKNSINQAYSHDEFLEKANKVHKNKYIYNHPYKKMHDYLIITCPHHGDFKQKPYLHINEGNGCPKCAAELTVSKGQIEVYEFVKSLGVGVKLCDRSLINPLELDIVCKKEKIAIEYNGVFWHSNYLNEEITEDTKNKHYNKYNLCRKIGYRLVQINEDEWIFNNEKIKNILRKTFNKCRCIKFNNCKTEFQNGNILVRFRGETVAEAKVEGRNIIYFIETTDIKIEKCIFNLMKKYNLKYISNNRYPLIEKELVPEKEFEPDYRYLFITKGKTFDKNDIKEPDVNKHKIIFDAGRTIYSVR